VLALSRTSAADFDFSSPDKVGVSIPVGGNSFRVATVLSLPDLASVESSMSKLPVLR